MRRIVEAAPREVMTKREKALKKKLIALLRDDGKGHRHAKYAERLEDFIVKIVSIEDDPRMTAAVNFQEITIYISEGFLTDPKTFYQLNVLMRHELAHYLMQHQIRMMDKLISKYGKSGATRISMSPSIHSLLNIIEDFEISNKRYSPEDKLIVKNMVLNFKTIGGLVTEEIRKDWQNLSVIEMYDLLSEEITRIQNQLRWSWNYTADVAEIGEQDKDWLKRSIRDTAYFYAKEKATTNFLGPIDKFIAGKALYHFIPFDSIDNKGRVKPCILKFNSLPTEYQELITSIYNEVNNTNSNVENQAAQTIYLKDNIRQLIQQVVKSSPFEVVTLKSPLSNKEIVKVYTPEEKFIVADVLRAILPTLELYKTWLEKVKKVLGDSSKYSTEDVEAVLAALTK